MAVLASNPRTQIVTRMRPHEDPRTLFVNAYPWFEEVCRAVREPGVAVIAVDDWTGNVVAYHGLRAAVNRCISAVGGRHERCDIVLPCQDVALRSFAIVVDPVEGWEVGAHVGYRMIDLRTTDGLEDEHGKALRSFRTDGPAIIRCGGYTIFLLPLGDATDWPSAAETAWEMLPERVYLDEQRPLRAVSPMARRTSVIFELPSLREANARLVEDDSAGILDVVDPQSHTTIPIGLDALAAGVLLGRYSRCDLVGSKDRSVSRVHAMLIQRGERILLVDLASTFGIGVFGGQRARIVELSEDTVAWLGCRTRLRWRLTQAVTPQ
jgi:hypothetical protein